MIFAKKSFITQYASAITVNIPISPEYPAIDFKTTLAVSPKSPLTEPVNELIKSSENVVCKVMQNLYRATGSFVNRLTAIKPFRIFRQVLCIFTLPDWYSIAVSNTATASPATNSAHPNDENKLKNAFTQLSSNISAAIPFIIPKKSATAP